MEKTHIDPSTPISELTVEQYLHLFGSISKPKRYEYGLNGIAKIFGCSKDTAQRIKKSGVIDDAIYQNKNIIVIDVEAALELFRENPRK